MFTTALRAEIDKQHPGVDQRYAEKIRHLLDAPESLRKRIAVRILERRAGHFMVDHGYATSTEAINWESCSAYC